MNADDFRAALLALPYTQRLFERECEAAAVEAMLAEVAHRVPGENYPVVDLEDLRAAYLAARRRE